MCSFYLFPSLSLLQDLQASIHVWSPCYITMQELDTKYYIFTPAGTTNAQICSNVAEFNQLDKQSKILLLVVPASILLQTSEE